MDNDKARELYRLSEIKYSDIGSKEIAKLIKCIKLELSNSDNELGMKLCKLRKKDVTYAEDGGIWSCYLMVDGAYFTRREAISFNTITALGYGFIGFAGWAGSKNTEPFINAFETWTKTCMISKATRYRNNKKLK